MMLEKKLFKTFATELSFEKNLRQNNFVMDLLEKGDLIVLQKVLLSVSFFYFLTLVSQL